MLHNKSKFLKEAAARIFYRSLATIASCLPKVVMLENVMGMLRCWKQAWPFKCEAHAAPGLESLPEAGEAWLPHRQGVCVCLMAVWCPRWSSTRSSWAGRQEGDASTS